jgi:DHA2 family multidrug resistance protein
MVITFVHEDDEIRVANIALAERQRRQFDWQGIVLLCVGLAALQYLLEEGARDDWFESVTINGCLAVALVGLVAFVIRELTAPAPAVDLRLFRDRSFSSATLIGFVMFAMLMVNMFLLPIFMQELLGFSATQTGWTLMPRAAVMLLMNPIVGAFYNRISPRVFVANGILFVSAGSFLMSRFTLATGNGSIIVAIIVQGVGFACLFAPLTAAALTNIPKHRLADATGLNSLLRQLGGSVGLAIFATLLTRFGIQARASIGAHLTSMRPEAGERLAAITRGLLSRGVDAATSQLAAAKAMGGLVFGQSMMLAFEKDFFLAGVIFLCVLPLLLLLKVSTQTRPVTPAHME